jgi:hypothetical protein
MINFEHPEDREYFANLLANGDVEKLDRDFSELFDFEHLAMKRWRFNKIRKKVLEERGNIAPDKTKYHTIRNHDKYQPRSNK